MSLLKSLQNKLFGTEWPVAVVQTVPAQSPGPWTGSPAIGQTQAFARSSNNTQNIVKLDEWGAPDVWTITLGATYSDNNWPVAAGNLGIQAQIEIGVGGGTKTFIVDWADGVVLNVTANAIRVNAFYFPYATGIPIAPPSDLRLTALLARGSKSSGGRGPTFTCAYIPVNTIGAPVVTKFIRIPDFATELYILPQNLGGISSPYNAANHVHLYESTNPAFTAGIEIYDTPMNVLSQVVPLRIPGSARYFNLVIAQGNFSGSALVPIFNIGL
jgi:hypothetical protein